MLYKLKNFQPSEEREMRPGEIKPASAEHSRTYVNVYEGDFVADHALDRLWWTSSQTVTGSDREVWWKANLDQIYCVETVFFWLDNNRDNPMKWSCTDTGCVCLVGGCSAHSLVILPGKNSLSVSFEGALPDGLPSTSDCQYGDTIKLQRESFKAYGIILFEVSIVGNSTGKQGELTFHDTLFKHHYEYLISIEMKWPYVVWTKSSWHHNVILRLHVYILMSLDINSCSRISDVWGWTLPGRNEELPALSWRSVESKRICWQLQQVPWKQRGSFWIWNEWRGLQLE